MLASETTLLSARLPGATFGLSVELTRRWLSSLESVADGHPFLEIARVFELTLQQLIAVLQFAAEGAAPAAAGR